MRLIDADALLKHEISADRMGAMLVVGKGHILGAPTIAGEIVTPEMKARILDRFEKADDLAEKQDELIERLQKRLSAAEGVCYAAKGLIELGDNPLGSVYLDLLQCKVQRWMDIDAEEKELLFHLREEYGEEKAMKKIVTDLNNGDIVVDNLGGARR